MNEVFVLIAKEKFNMDGGTVVLSAITPLNIEFLYQVMEKQGQAYKDDYDVMLQYYVGGEIRSIEKYDFESNEFVSWIDMSSAIDCE